VRDKWERDYEVRGRWEGDRENAGRGERRGGKENSMYNDSELTLKKEETT
jgi:hypothetical protein